MDPVLRLARTHSAVIPLFKEDARNDTSSRAMDRNLQQATIPSETLSIDEPDTKHKDISNSGIYTQAELEDWSLIVQYPNYETAFINKIALGSCSLTCKCGYRPLSTILGIKPYDLNQLLQKSTKTLDV